MNEEILRLYFNEGRKQVDIANILGISKYKVSRIVTKDKRYIEEKDKRKVINKQKRSNDITRRTKEKRLKIQFKSKVDDLILKNMHNQASMEMSKCKKLSDYAYRNWNTSAYSYNNEKKRFEFREELGRSYDVKKYLKG